MSVNATRHGDILAEICADGLNRKFNPAHAFNSWCL